VQYLLGEAPNRSSQCIQGGAADGGNEVAPDLNVPVDQFKAKLRTGFRELEGFMLRSWKPR